MSAVAQLDAAVVDELPGLPFDEDGVDDLVIEWDDDIDDTSELPAAVFELSLELEQFSDADADASAATTTTTHGDVEPVVEPDVSGAVDAPGEHFEFSVVWPNGSEEPATEATAYVEEPSGSLDEPSDVETTDAEMTDVETNDIEMTDVELAAELDAELDAVLTEADDVDFQFTMPPLALSDEPESADAEVPDDVAEAVRRAIAAIESASVTEAETAPGPESSVQLDEIADVEILDGPPITELAEAAPVVQGPAEPPAGIGGFAPPTMATRAEVLYAQMEADDSTADAAAPTVDGSSPSSGVASVVFVDDPAEDDADGDNDRNSALRRLIGSLRRKDH